MPPAGADGGNRVCGASSRAPSLARPLRRKRRPDRTNKKAASQNGDAACHVVRRKRLELPTF